MRRKILPISHSLLLELFKAGEHSAYRVIANAIPGDTRVVDVKFNGFTNTTDILVESDSFAEVSEGGKYSEILPVLEKIK